MFRRAWLPALLILGTAVPVAQAQVKLEYKFPEGVKSTYKTTSKTHQILSIMGMDIETEAEESVLTSSANGKRNADGTLPVAQKIESLHTQLSLPGGINVTFDSAEPNAKIDNPQVAFLGDVFKALVGVGYTIVLDAKDKVKFVEGTEAFDAKIEGLDPKAAAALRGRLTAAKIKQAFEQEIGNLPEVLARQGEPWEVTEVMDLGYDQSLTLRKRFEYLGTVEKEGKQLDKIGVRSLTVVYAMDPKSSSPLKVTKSDLKVDTSEGTILFDREAGEKIESTLVTRIKGNLTLEAGGKELPSTLDLTLDVSGKREPIKN
ncbi:DUF6263 family protein [Singulisphaera acidiphila]|uniref:DUF2125 domain-containing protein n=1 Tax=Singulisphaera acidiphila (strain ATCC BAA-1392 / DSM 18658 / VKM B-2454 / MOB10) TaxID=886293 RepID=L0D8Z0_SINAD|nr:DUF6263 family protein [Singulisphaera acidiphila]AGA25707.1 hypothetical protein Sinac_1320 [Singulisphaera acidiphila DSM 18658]